MLSLFLLVKSDDIRITLDWTIVYITISQVRKWLTAWKVFAEEFNLHKFIALVHICWLDNWSHQIKSLQIEYDYVKFSTFRAENIPQKMVAIFGFVCRWVKLI